jgi:hypothetical protein
LNKAESNLPGIIFRPAVEEDEQAMLRGTLITRAS